MNFDFLT
ncbi:hypothetical protein VCCP1040_3544, partial [Vibrio cholerae CP1040(13)]